jgi:hypothetical protein
MHVALNFPVAIQHVCQRTNATSFDRWTAPEIFKQGKATTASDVSFVGCFVLFLFCFVCVSCCPLTPQTN